MTERLLTAGKVGERLPELLDTRKLQVELGITRAAAEKIMRRLPVVQIEDLRGLRPALRCCAFLEARTFAKHEVPS